MIKRITINDSLKETYDNAVDNIFSLQSLSYAVLILILAVSGMISYITGVILIAGALTYLFWVLLVYNIATVGRSK